MPSKERFGPEVLVSSTGIEALSKRQRCWDEKEIGTTVRPMAVSDTRVCVCKVVLIIHLPMPLSLFLQLIKIIIEPSILSCS